MADQLFNGQKAEVTRGRTNLANLVAGMGWRMTENTPKDLYFDMVAYALEEDGYCHKEEDIIYFSNKLVATRRDTIFKHMDVDEIIKGRELKREDFEQILVGLYEVDRRIRSIIFCAGIYNSKENGYTLKQIEDLHFHLFNEENKEEILFSTFSKYFTIESCTVFGKLYRTDDGGWAYEAINQGFIGDIGTLHAIYYRDDNEERTEEEKEADNWKPNNEEGYGYSSSQLLDPDGTIEKLKKEQEKKIADSNVNLSL